LVIKEYSSADSAYIGMWYLYILLNILRYINSYETYVSSFINL